MNKFLENIFENRPKELGESSKKLYTRNLIKLNDGKPVDNLNFLKDIKKIRVIIEPYAATTQRSYIISACVVLSGNDSFEDLYNSYYNELSKMNNDLKNTTTKSESQKKLDYSR